MKRRSSIGGKSGKAGRHKATPKRPRSAKAVPNSHSKTISQETELARRTRERDEALERFSATSEVLKVISSSPADLNLVFETILQSATRICEAKFGTLFRFDGGVLQPVAQVGTPVELIEAQRRREPHQATPGGLLDQVVQTKKVIHSPDRAIDPVPGLAAKFAGARSVVGVPMLKGSELIGAIVIYRQQVRPFTDKQINLVQNFAAQAVIAIENARLLNELRQRTEDLTESLEQQTATSEVLKVISSSPGELEPVFNAILENATRLCEAKFGVLFRSEEMRFAPLRCMAHRWPMRKSGGAIRSSVRS